VAAQFKVSVCACSLAVITSSNSVEGTDACHLCCVLSGIGLCEWPIPRPEESYRVCVCVLLSVIGVKKTSTPKMIRYNQLGLTKKKNFSLYLLLKCDNMLGTTAEFRPKMLPVPASKATSLTKLPYLCKS